MDKKKSQLEEKFLCMQIENQYYLLSVFEVVQILEKKPDEAILVSWREKKSSRPIFILLESEEKRLALEVDDVLGIISIFPKYQFELPDMIKEELPLFICGVSYWQEKKKLCFLLDSNLLDANNLKVEK